MKTVTRDDVTGAFLSGGIGPGSLVMVHSDISRIGPAGGAATREETLGAYAGGITGAIGKTGTLAVLACSESYARHGTPFVHEDTPSEWGVLSEYIRTRPDAVRSMHPLFSVAALGPGSNALCKETAPTGFGYDSPFERLSRFDGVIACLGVDLHAMTFVHHIEQTFGVPYGYTKEWDAPVFREGVPVKTRFFAFVRYLDCAVEYDFTRFQDVLFEKGAASRTPLGYGHLYTARAKDVFSIGMDCLRNDPFFFLKAPPEKEPWKK